MDTWVTVGCRPLLCALALKGPRTEIPEGRMAPLAVVEDLNVLEQVGASRLPCRLARIVDQLDLERCEETLGHGVVPTVAAPAPAADHPFGGEHRLAVAAGVLLPRSE
jgi:hypothetical protein